jgi:hypothetical protein
VQWAPARLPQQREDRATLALWQVRVQELPDRSSPTIGLLSQQVALELMRQSDLAALLSARFAGQIGAKPRCSQTPAAA